MTKKIDNVIYTVGYRLQDSSQTMFIRGEHWPDRTVTPKPGMMFSARKQAERELAKVQKCLQERIDTLRDQISRFQSEYSIKELEIMQQIKPEVVALRIEFDPV